MRNDRRSVMLSLTEEGKVVALGIQEGLHAFDAGLTEDLSEQEMAFLASAASKIEANYAAMTRAQSGSLMGCEN